ncbi:VacJ family lipoprotein [Actimicrobium sp. CCI2.3]|uniref:MlaA family lipoprotein n=1 Tax=Actimicrobium sp. CCI2.3 TaxID=3048616 RepID=UPI002AB33815|nr:VacJ family lipoprotein [Actimicrobium sp. CCI2.3]MDY7573363.1 VacJ family lipoprotein [Actimicrobium sp. CCI2.3]MEB0021761.1 VacJ family lipoprotein [Actimicrobium sp. CCI2.3]
MNPVVKRVSMLVLAVAMSGCATSRNPQDPFEGYNRAMFSFNDGLDRVAIKPAATAYRNVLPQFVQTGVGNFFGNLGDVWTAVNNLLQGKVEDGLNDFMRVAVNSTLGLGGLLDISSEAGLQKHREDFGQTLGRWGVSSGPYVVLPLFGSSTLRDTAATPLDIVGDPWTYKDPVNVRNMGTAVRLVDLRASVLDASSLIEDAALDRYEFVRDAYMQRRQSRVYDGDVPKGKGRKSSVDDSYLNERSATSSEADGVTVPVTALPQAPVSAEAPSVRLADKTE